VAVNIAEWAAGPRRLLPPEVYDYYTGGSGSERTPRASTHPWQQHCLLPRVLRDVSAVDTSVRLPGLPETAARTPAASRPPGSRASRILRRTGDRPGGALMVLSTRSA
jgi:hypothetical protein